MEFRRVPSDLALARLLGRGRVIRPAVIAVEAVIRRVEEDLLLRMLGGELLHAFGRDHRVLLAEVAHHRDARLDVGVVEDAAAVVRHRGSQPRHLCRGHPRDEAAPAIADDADLARRRCGLHGGFDVFHGEVERDLGAQLAAFLDIGRRVAEVDVLLHAVEHRRRDRHVAVGGEAVGHFLDVAVDAEDFLDHDDGAARFAGGVGAVGGEPLAVRCGQFDDLAHGRRILAMKTNAQELFQLARAALEGAGAHPRMAAAAAKHLVRAEEQGLATHGLSRVPFYCSMLRNGRADGAAHPAMLAERGGACLIDNRDGLPYVSVEWAVGEAIQRARRNGIGFAGIRNSAHVGVLGIHLLPVAEAGLVGFASTNSPAASPPWGGKKALFGTNLVAAVFPRKDQNPIVVDLALTPVVRGRIMMAMRKGERIPDGWALDRDGKPTTDPKEAIEHGSLFPIGGAKGAMLALMFELICAALTGSAIGTEADSFFSEEGNKPRIGQAFIAIDPGALAGTAKYLERVETVVRTMLADAEVRLPGARRFAAEKSARAQGIEVPDELLAQIEKLAQ